MSSIFPVPTGRSSDLLVHQRLLGQLQSDQRDLLRLQDQLSTGRRLTAPSQDAPAAQRALGLQRLLEQKDQTARNMDSSRSYLNVTDQALANVTHLLADVQAIALSAADSTFSDSQRQAAIQQVQHVLEQLVQVGNHKYAGRSLFAGSTTAARPLETGERLVAYHGNETAVNTIVDGDLLLASNVTGHQVFGTLSAGVQGTAELTPDLTAQTRLSDLRGGAGISSGALLLSDGQSNRTVDLSTAHTVGDVLRLIEAKPPEGRQITARIEGQRLVLEIDQAGGGNLTVREAAGGTTAAELGILAVQGTGVDPLVGQELAPRLRQTTRLQDVLGGQLDQQSGLQIVNGEQTFTVRFEDAVTVEDLLNAINGSGAQVLAEINAQGTGIQVRSRLSGADFHIGENGGLTATQLGLRTFTHDTPLDQLNHGSGVHTADGPDLILRRPDGLQLEVDLSAARTMGDVLDRINQHPDNQGPAAVSARLAAVGNGIELSGPPAAAGDPLAAIRVRGSRAAWDLGLVPRGEEMMQAEAEAGEPQLLVGADANPLETRGAFNSLIRLQQAMEQSDLAGIQRAAALLDEDFQRVTMVRAELGVRQQGLDALQQRQQQEQIELQRALSHEQDIELAEVISQLTARQASLEASLRLMGRTFQMTLLDFL